jgi:hypothetical protein
VNEDGSQQLQNLQVNFPFIQLSVQTIFDQPMFVYFRGVTACVNIGSNFLRFFEPNDRLSLFNFIEIKFYELANR